VFSEEDRERVREFTFEIARADARIVGGAITGSIAAGHDDRWSDVDVAFGVGSGQEVQTILEDWTAQIDATFGVVHRFDLSAGTAT
jgi:hypothetical protein